MSKLRKLTTGFDAGLLSLRASGSCAPAACDPTRPTCVQCLSAQMLGDFDSGRPPTPAPAPGQSQTPAPVPGPAPSSLDAYLLAGAIKQYLRQLPEPLLTFELYDKWAHAATLYALINCVNAVRFQTHLHITDIGLVV